MRRLGFSLIELMVIVAIIGITSIVSLSYFRDYRARAQITSALPVLNQIKNKAIEYYNVNGVFPDAIHLGLNSPQASITNPETISPLITEAYVISTAYHDEGYTCTGNFGEMQFYFDKDQIGISDGGFDFGVYFYYADINGTVISTAEDGSDSGNEYVQNLMSGEYPTRADLFDAAGCTN